ncbi:MAG: hypothetical protein O3C10_06415 [Chloroflexi bacterium]|nr:hypothetical protein [Chloroflexota bacterium]
MGLTAIGTGGAIRITAADVPDFPNLSRTLVESSFTHGIDLSGVSHRPGQSENLEPKRQRAWERMTDRERRYAVRVYGTPIEGWELPCVDAGGGYERALYVLATTNLALTAEQIVYLMIARHYRNADISSVRKQLAIGVRRGDVRSIGNNRFATTDEAVEKLRSVERRWLAARQADRLARVTRAANLAAALNPELPTNAFEGPEMGPASETGECAGVTLETTVSEADEPPDKDAEASENLSDTTVSEADEPSDVDAEASENLSDTTVPEPDEPSYVDSEAPEAVSEAAAPETEESSDEDRKPLEIPIDTAVPEAPAT